MTSCKNTQCDLPGCYYLSTNHRQRANCTTRENDVFPSLFTYCPHCAARMVDTTCDQIARRQCSQCGWIQYRNPVTGVAVAVVENGELLLGQRHDGGWCIPCGYVEYDETIQQAAIREFREETGCEVTLHGVLAALSNFHNPHRQTVGVWFNGHRTGGELQAGSDLIDAKFFPLQSLPELIFPTDREVVRMLIKANA